jgi:NAD-dependent dihydropyrimidine dehydrogenase PreA subunit
MATHTLRQGQVFSELERYLIDLKSDLRCDPDIRLVHFHIGLVRRQCALCTQMEEYCPMKNAQAQAKAKSYCLKSFRDNSFNTPRIMSYKYLM